MAKKDLYPILMIGAGLIFFPLLAKGNEYFITILVFWGINAIIAMGLSLLMGYAGQISLGHAAFFGLGAYSSGILTAKYSWPPMWGIIWGIILAGGIAYLVGKPTLRLKGHYMAVATLGIGEIFYIIFNELIPLTGGPSGLSGIPLLTIGGESLEGIKFLYLVWLVFLLVLIFSLNLVNSRIGRAWRAIHGSELGALTLGVDVARYKLQIFVLSAIYAALAGSLYAHFVTFISPSSFGLMFSILLLMMVVVGGAETLWGALLGAGVLTWLPEYLRGLEDFEVLAYGAILMVALLFMPRGILFALKQIFSRPKK
ncbi:MAG: branched-chain amino acid ABC transporter permease [Thermodesulfobacteriota bacterium]